MSNLFKIILQSILLLAFVACGSKIDVAGSGSDTEVVGVVETSTGAPAQGVIVVLADSQKVIVTDTTDNLGEYHFLTKSRGILSVTAKKGDTLIASVSIELQDEERYTIDTLVLDRSVIVKVIVPAVSRMSDDDSVYLSGMPFATEAIHYADSILCAVPQNSGNIVVSSSTIGYYGGTLFPIDTIGVTTSSDTIVVCHKVSVLYLYDTLSLSQELADTLRDSFTIIKVKSIGDFTSSDTNGIDVVYFSADIDSLYNNDSLFKNLKKPIVVASNTLLLSLGMIAAQDSIGEEESRNCIVKEYHGVLPPATFANSVIELFDPSGVTNIEWSKSSGNGFVVLESNIIPSRNMFYYYTPNDTLLDTTRAMGYRIGLFGSTTTIPNRTGQFIIWRVLHWSKEMGELE